MRYRISSGRKASPPPPPASKAGSRAPGVPIFAGGVRPLGQSAPSVELLLDRDELPPLSPELRRFYRFEPDDGGGYLTPPRAAEVQGVDTEELAAMVSRGELSAIRRGSAVLVRPAAIRRR